MFKENLLSLIIWLPALCALVLLALPERKELKNWFRYGALGASLPTFIASLLLLPGFEATGKLQFVLDLEWANSIGAHYTLGVDGVSVWLVLLNTLLFPLALISSIGVITQREKMYYA